MGSSLNKNPPTAAQQIQYVTNCNSLYPIAKSMEASLDWHFSKNNHTNLLHLQFMKSAKQLSSDVDQMHILETQNQTFQNFFKADYEDVDFSPIVSDNKNTDDQYMYQALFVTQLHPVTKAYALHIPYQNKEQVSVEITQSKHNQMIQTYDQVIQRLQHSVQIDDTQCSFQVLVLKFVEKSNSNQIELASVQTPFISEPMPGQTLSDELPENTVRALLVKVDMMIRKQRNMPQNPNYDAKATFLNFWIKVVDQTARTELADVMPKVSLGREFKQDIRLIGTPNTQDIEASDVIQEQSQQDPNERNTPTNKVRKGMSTLQMNRITRAVGSQEDQRDMRYREMAVLSQDTNTVIGGQSLRVGEINVTNQRTSDGSKDRNTPMQHYSHKAEGRKFSKTRVQAIDAPTPDTERDPYKALSQHSVGKQSNQRISIISDQNKRSSIVASSIGDQFQPFTENTKRHNHFMNLISPTSIGLANEMPLEINLSSIKPGPIQIAAEKQEGLQDEMQVAETKTQSQGGVEASKFESVRLSQQTVVSTVKSSYMPKGHVKNMLYDKKHNAPLFSFILTQALLSIREHKIRRFLNTMGFKIRIHKMLKLRSWARQKLTEIVWLWRQKTRVLTKRETARMKSQKWEYQKRYKEEERKELQKQALKEQIQKMQQQFESSASEYDEYNPDLAKENIVERDDGKPRYRVAALKSAPKVKVQLGFGNIGATAEDKAKAEMEQKEAFDKKMVMVKKVHKSIKPRSQEEIDAEQRVLDLKREKIKQEQQELESKVENEKAKAKEKRLKNKALMMEAKGPAGVADLGKVMKLRQNKNAKDLGSNLKASAMARKLKNEMKDLENHKALELAKKLKREALQKQVDEGLLRQDEMEAAALVAEQEMDANQAQALQNKSDQAVDSNDEASLYQRQSGDEGEPQFIKVKSRSKPKKTIQMDISQSQQGINKSRTNIHNYQMPMMSPDNSFYNEGDQQIYNRSSRPYQLVAHQYQQPSRGVSNSDSHVGGGKREQEGKGLDFSERVNQVQIDMTQNEQTNLLRLASRESYKDQQQANSRLERVGEAEEPLYLPIEPRPKKTAKQCDVTDMHTKTDYLNNTATEDQTQMVDTIGNETVQITQQQSPSPSLFNNTINSPKRHRQCNEGDKVDVEYEESPDQSMDLRSRQHSYVDPNAMPREVLNNIEWDKPKGFDSLGRPAFRTIDHKTTIQKPIKQRQQSLMLTSPSSDQQYHRNIKGKRFNNRHQSLDPTQYYNAQGYSRENARVQNNNTAMPLIVERKMRSNENSTRKLLKQQQDIGDLNQMLQKQTANLNLSNSVPRNRGNPAMNSGLILPQIDPLLVHNSNSPGVGQDWFMQAMMNNGGIDLTQKDMQMNLNSKKRMLRHRGDAASMNSNYNHHRGLH